ncbi:MAG TPA: histidine triad nucleotide-binding protein [Usitatibacteraceae bacterium]|nr:histidine triad nucleotide-binding protein [Usitatibacteraceae bacterium]
MKRDDCVFCRIAAGEIPSRKVFEDDEIVAFHDIQPVAPVHLLMVPKAHVDSLADCSPEHAPVLGRMMAMAGRLAREQGATDGFRLIVNTGRVGRQDVYHLHIHIIGGPDRLPRMIATE